MCVLLVVEAKTTASRTSSVLARDVSALFISWKHFTSRTHTTPPTHNHHRHG